MKFAHIRRNGQKNRLISTIFPKIQQRILSKPVEIKKGRKQPQGCSRFFEKLRWRLIYVTAACVDVDYLKRAISIGHPLPKIKGTEGVAVSLDALIA